MKRFIIVFSIITLLAIFVPGFSSLAQPANVPHENPVTVRSSPDLTTLLLSYSQLINLATAKQYQTAQDRLAELEQVNIPDDLRYIINRYSVLYRQLFASFDDLESTLDEATALISRNQLREAKDKLNAAEITTHDAQLLLSDVQEATRTLANSLGISAAPASSQVKQAFDRLEQGLDRLGQLIDELNQLWESLNEQNRAQAIGLIPTELSLNVTPDSAFVGESITVSGKLSGDNPLPGRQITLLLDNQPLVTDTSPDGAYTASITLPYKYATSLAIGASYIPTGEDITTYLASQSPQRAVNITFYPTRLEVSTPETAHPGLPITINGRVSSTGDITDRTIRVFLDDNQFIEETTRDNFSLELTVPPHTPLGKHNLTVIVLPRGRYADVSKQLAIDISKLPLQADIQLPQPLIITRSLEISGRIFHDSTPIQNARVNLNFRQTSATTHTANDGSFIASIDTPLDLSLAGSQELTVTIAAIEPWYAPLQLKIRVFTINPLNTGLLFFILLSVGLLVYRGSRTRPAAVREEKLAAQSVSQVPITTAPLPKAKPAPTGIKGRISSAYMSSLGVIENKTGIAMSPHSTLREYLQATTPLLSTAVKAFAELTAIAEVALYSAHRLRKDMASKAEQLTAIITEELNSESA